MLVMDLEVPETCRKCLCSCQVPNWPNSSDFDGQYQKILCRKDMKEHVPMDEGCPIQKTGRLIDADALVRDLDDAKNRGEVLGYSPEDAFDTVIHGFVQEAEIITPPTK